MRRLGASGPMIVVVVTLALAAPAHAADPEEIDKRLVYCLGQERRAGLAEAAVTLGLATPGAPREQVRLAGRALTLEQWRSARPGDFDRACRALMAADPDLRTTGEPGPFDLLLTVLLPVVVGAALAMATTEWRAAATAGAQAGGELNDAALTFAAAHREFLAAWRGGRSDTGALEAAGDALAAQIRGVALARPSWREPARLLAALAAVTSRSANDWSNEALADRAALAAREGEAVAALTARVGGVAVRLRRPWLPHPTMRRADRHGKRAAT
ncbi:hypothetical protein [Spongiactinospora sp. TRM90649]|uniref:hypothetical protein n=1 Tax=Spongiactinospora sp. TRM90649 TaxID=3031114 RepID=UPI0023FA47DE|nr:hypothetical protein [Spongiactinospora sp. TRM90649]MDF5758189.1 hypothetical protein [Spongiactinospora sp. TRM90649]